MGQVENLDHVRNIADRLTAVAEGRAYVDDSGEFVYVDDSEDIPEEYEAAGMWDYFEDVLDIDFIITSELDYKSVRLCVACGGPSIYVDTDDNSVQLYWWGERASCSFPSYVGEAIDEAASELYSMKAGR